MAAISDNALLAFRNQTGVAATVEFPRLVPFNIEEKEQIPSTRHPIE